MSRFAEGTDPEYIKKINEGLYAEGMFRDTPLPPSTKSAGYMGIPKIGWIAIIGVLGYFAYTKGMFK
jgi:hypothetical protein